MPSTTDVTLPTEAELSAALMAVMDLDEFQIEPLTRRVFERINTKGTQPTFTEIGKLASFVSDALGSLEEAVQRLERVQRCYSDLVSLAQGASVEELAPNFNEHGDAWPEVRLNRLEAVVG